MRKSCFRWAAASAVLATAIQAGEAPYPAAERPVAIKSVVRPDPKTGKLVRSVVVAAKPVAPTTVPKTTPPPSAPVAPPALLRALRPLIARSMLGDMQEPVQKERAYAFVYGAAVWKWKTAAHAAWDFELIGRLGSIKREVFVLNGTRDKIHDQVFYPRIAAELPRGRFLFMPTDERNRERLFGAAAVEFSHVSAQTGLPSTLARFEKNIH